VLTRLIAELIIENWGKKVLQKIEKRLFERYELSLEHCLIEFEKVDEVLREFVGYRVEGLEQRFINKWSRK